MRYHWIKDRSTQNQFIIYWEEGLKNYADYFTKHFSPSYHQKIRPLYVLKGNNMSLESEGVLIPIHELNFTQDSIQSN